MIKQYTGERQGNAYRWHCSIVSQPLPTNIVIKDVRRRYFCPLTDGVKVNGLTNGHALMTTPGDTEEKSSCFWKGHGHIIENMCFLVFSDICFQLFFLVQSSDLRQ